MISTCLIILSVKISCGKSTENVYISYINETILNYM